MGGWIKGQMGMRRTRPRIVKSLVKERRTALGEPNRGSTERDQGAQCASIAQHWQPRARWGPTSCKQQRCVLSRSRKRRGAWRGSGVWTVTGTPKLEVAGSAVVAQLQPRCKVPAVLRGDWRLAALGGTYGICLRVFCVSAERENRTGATLINSLATKPMMWLHTAGPLAHSV